MGPLRAAVSLEQLQRYGGQAARAGSRRRRVEDPAGVWEAEIHRLRGEIHRSRGPDFFQLGESCFHQALSVARTQEAKSLELRAATSLARLWQGQGKLDEARGLLAPIYEWFTEGFDTADLKEAKALLKQLS